MIKKFLPCRFPERRLLFFGLSTTSSISLYIAVTNILCACFEMIICLSVFLLMCYNIICEFFLVYILCKYIGLIGSRIPILYSRKFTHFRVMLHFSWLFSSLFHSFCEQLYWSFEIAPKIVWKIKQRSPQKLLIKC